MNIFPQAVFAVFFKFITYLSQSVEINLSLVHDSLDNFCLVPQEVLESAVLVNIAASFLEILVFVKMKLVFWDLLEWNVVDVHTLAKIIVRHMTLIVLFELVEFVVPQ
jgi:hypothetical protein